MNHGLPNSGTRCSACGAFHYKCQVCGADCTAGQPAGPATTSTDRKVRCSGCQRAYERRTARLYDAAEDLLTAAKEARESLVCIATRSTPTAECSCWACDLARTLDAAIGKAEN